MNYSRDDLVEAKRQIDSTLHKLKETIKTFESKENPERYKSQITGDKEKQHQSLQGQSASRACGKLYVFLC